MITGDVNACHRTWETAENRRGIRMKRWAGENGWVIHAPNEPSYTITRGVRTLDIIMNKEIKYSNYTVITPTIKNISDHKPVSMTINPDKMGKVTRWTHQNRSDVTQTNHGSPGIISR